MRIKYGYAAFVYRDFSGLVLKSYATDGFTLTTENKASSQIEAKDPVRMSARSGMMSTSQTKVAAI